MMWCVWCVCGVWWVVGVVVVAASGRFSDLTHDEFRALTGAACPTSSGTPPGNGPDEACAPPGDAPDPSPVHAHHYGNPPSSVDWAAKGYVTPVLNQGSCLCSYANAAVGAVESAVVILNGGTLTQLSTQQVVDCSTPQGNSGCATGIPGLALNYVVAKQGLCTQAGYPYTGVAGTCKVPFQDGLLACGLQANSAITAKVSVTPNNASVLVARVAQQPVAVRVDASSPGLQNYAGGVYTGACGASLNHALLVVGYGTDPSGVQYWKARNSWGAAWGESGYIRIAKGAGYDGLNAGTGQCGIYSDPVLPTF